MTKEKVVFRLQAAWDALNSIIIAQPDCLTWEDDEELVNLRRRVSIYRKELELRK